jgi:hypothetical protein
VVDWVLPTDSTFVDDDGYWAAWSRLPGAHADEPVPPENATTVTPVVAADMSSHSVRSMARSVRSASLKPTLVEMIWAPAGEACGVRGTECS